MRVSFKWKTKTWNHDIFHILIPQFVLIFPQMPVSPCAGCGDILCPKSHPIYPSDLNAPCPRSPTQATAVAMRPCSNLSFPTYAPGPPTIGTADSDALMRYRWPTSAPVYFYSKLVSASTGSKPDGLGVVTSPGSTSIGPGLNPTSLPPQGNGGRPTKPTKSPITYRNKGVFHRLFQNGVCILV